MRQRTTLGTGALLAALGLFGLTSPAAYAQSQLGIYTFTGAIGDEGAFPVDVQPTNAVFSDMTRGTGVTPSASANRFSASGWTVAAAVDLTQYYAFTLTANSGFRLDLDSLNLDERRSGTGITQWVLRSSLDNFASNVYAATVPDDTDTRTARIGLPAAFNSVPAVEFRIYGFASEATPGTWRIDNVAPVGQILPTGPAGPSVGFAATTLSVSEGAGTVQIPVTLSAPATTVVTVNVGLTGASTATAGTDFTFASQVLTFPVGSTTQNATIIITDDTQAEPDETVVMALSNPSTGVSFGANSTFTLTITDNDVATATVGFASPILTVSENAGAVQVPVSLAAAATSVVTVDVVLATTGTATAGADFTYTTQTLTFPVGSTTQNATLTVTDDAQGEPDETVVLTLGNASTGAVLGATTTFTLTITDNDGGAPVITVNFAAANVTVGENAGTVQVPVVLTNPSTLTATTVEVMVSGGTATTGTDYAFTTQTLTFPAGSTAPQNATIAVTDDAQQESDETIVLMLMNASTGAVIGAGATFTVTITDNDTGPGPVVPPLRTIAAVTANDAQGQPLLAGLPVRVRGIVIGPNIRTAGYQTSLQDLTGGIGLFRAVSLGTQTMNQGDSLELVGVVGQFNGLTQIAIDSFRVLLPNQVLPTPRLVSILNESTESELVKIVGPLSIVDPAQWTGMGSGFTVQITDGTLTYDLRIVRNTDVYAAPVPTQAFTLTGIGGQFDSTVPLDGGYQITPRALSDFTFITGLAESAAARSLSVYPNPATARLTIAANPQTATAALYDGLGRVVRTATLANGTATLDVATLPAGVYVVRAGAASSRFLKQ